MKIYQYILFIIFNLLFIIINYNVFSGCCNCIEKNKDSDETKEKGKNPDKTKRKSKPTLPNKHYNNGMRNSSQYNEDPHEYNRKVFNNTMEICEENEYVKEAIKESINVQSFIPERSNTYIKNGEQIFIKTEFNTKSEGNIEFQDKTTIEAALYYLKQTGYKKKIAILNFANWTDKGGGVTRGAVAQEEAICRCSTLYKNLIADNVSKFYESHNSKDNNNNCIYNDDIIYSPKVLILKDDTDSGNILTLDLNYDNNNQNFVSVITCAAPYNYNGKIFTDEDIHKIHLSRGKRILDIALNNDIDIIILGAFGCGAFKNNPIAVSKAYKEILINQNYQKYFEKVVFAIPDKNHPNYKTFFATFNNTK